MKAVNIVLISFVLYHCSPENIKTSLEKDNLRGKVKYVKEYSIVQDQTSENRPAGIVLEKFYNFKGYIIESAEYADSNALTEKVVYNYDETNRIISQSAFSKDRKMKWRLEYVYNETDSSVLVNLFDDKGSQLSSTNYRFINDEILNPVKENDLQFGEKLYDKAGNVAEIKNSWDLTRIKYQYVSGLLTESLNYDEKNRLTSKETYRYDSQRNLTEKRTFDKSGKSTGFQKYHYVFDKQGNWINKIEFTDGKKTDIVERVIEYY